MQERNDRLVANDHFSVAVVACLSQSFFAHFASLMTGIYIYRLCNEIPVALAIEMIRLRCVRLLFIERVRQTYARALMILVPVITHVRVFVISSIAKMRQEKIIIY